MCGLPELSLTARTGGQAALWEEAFLASHTRGLGLFAPGFEVFSTRSVYDGGVYHFHISSLDCPIVPFTRSSHEVS